MNKLIQINHLAKTFNSGKHSQVDAVQDINLEINGAEIVLIMGPSGSGKTTLLTIIGGLLKPTEGNIFFDERDLTKLSQNEMTIFRRENIGFIFQSFNLLKNLTAFENVSIASFNKKGVKEKTTKLFRMLGLQERMNFKPDDLSGGERQRVAIARSLINDPKLILADEPTANLDKNNGSEVMKLLYSIACEEGKAVIIVSHDERIKNVAHRIIYIEDGKLIREEAGGHNTTCPIDHKN